MKIDVRLIVRIGICTTFLYSGCNLLRTQSANQGAQNRPAKLIDQGVAIDIAKAEYQKTVRGSTVLSNPESYEIEASISEDKWRVQIYDIHGVSKGTVNDSTRAYIIDGSTGHILITELFQ